MGAGGGGGSGEAQRTQIPIHAERCSQALSRVTFEHCRALSQVDNLLSHIFGVVSASARLLLHRNHMSLTLAQRHRCHLKGKNSDLVNCGRKTEEKVVAYETLFSYIP